MTVWYINNGPESDVVISSRVRIARNLIGYPFPYKMDPSQGLDVLKRVSEAVLKSNISKELIYIDTRKLNAVERQSLVEKHLISPDLVSSTNEHGVIVNKDENISIMINEEDHLRIQCMFAGMQIEDAWKACDRIDSLLEKKVDFAFNNDLGYLTCCPTNIGTGIRASVMLHLPALVMTGYIRGILEGCSKIGVAVRGIYGENSEAAGNMFQISNQVTLGQTEEEIVASIKNISLQVIEQERTLRGELYKQNPFRLEDKVFRSLGVFSNARIISSEESLKLLSDVRLGIDMGIIKNIKIEVLNEIMLFLQPANLQRLSDKPLSPEERDIQRAELIRSKLRIKNTNAGDR